jgi:diguanylate cyclase (GGDEF)-like protein/PAS domain S-box-containing protein
MDKFDAAEKSRLNTLKSFHILDTPSEEVFDHFTQMAARICETPIAAITFVDERRQWFKSVVGLNLSETERSISFCTHAIRGKRPFIVPDALQNPLFADNPLVVGPPHLRFYAGMPLVSPDGFAIGAFAVMDKKPRNLTEIQIAALEMLAEQVMMHIELRHQRQELEQVVAERDRINAELLRQTNHLREAQRIAEIGSWEWLIGTNHVIWSDEIYRILGINRADFKESYDLFMSLVHPEDRSLVLNTVEPTTEGREPLDIEHRIVRPNGEVRYLHERAEMFVNEEGRRILAGTTQDVTAQRKSQEQLHLLSTSIARMSDVVMITEAAPLDEPGPRIVFVNDAFEKITGYRRDEVLGKSPRMLQGQKTQRAELDRIHAALKQGQPVTAELINYKKSGGEFWEEIDITPVREATGRLTHFVAIERNVTERKQREKELAQTYRALEMLTRCNQALVRLESEQQLLEEICHIAVDTGGYRTAWVGYAQHDEARSIKPVALAGAAGEVADIAKISISWSEDTPKGRGPGGRAIRSGMPVVSEDIAKDPGMTPWYESARQRGYCGVISLPLRDKDGAFGILGLHTTEVRPVTDKELNLLQEVADNLAFGIGHLRSQEKRRHMEQAVVKVAAGVSAASGTEFFLQLAYNMAEALGAAGSVVARFLPGKPVAIRTISAVVDGQVMENFNYVIEGTACECFLTETDCIMLDIDEEQFPTPNPLIAFGAQSCVGRRLEDSAGHPLGLLCVMFRGRINQLDFITSTLQIFAARAAAELERQESDARIRDQAALLDKAQDAIIVCGTDYRITFWNKGAERLYGWAKEEALGRHKAELLYDDPADFQRATSAVQEYSEWRGEIRKRRKDGKLMTIDAHWTLVRDDNGNPQSILGITSDVTQRKAAEREIERLAFYDPLTGLPNRRLLLDRLQHALATSKRSGHTGALLFIDLDNFKTLNDTLGHDKGDLLLKEVAQRLETCVPRKSDTVARFGGDEFVVMLEDLSEIPGEAGAQAELVGEKILAVFTPMFQLGSAEHHTTPSIGIALFDGQLADVDELLKRADLAMYQAKAAGRNTIRFFDPDMQTVVTARVQLETDFRQGLQKDEFILLYQPQTDGNGHIQGMEALVRWQHSVRGIVAPANFIPLAEETGLITRLGQWVLEAACMQLVEWSKIPGKSHMSMAVNVSARQFRHPDFVDQVLAVLRRTGANPKNLKLELTESLLIDNMEDTITKMTMLKRGGVGFSLDDFGTGYSSLSYLKQLPLDQIKIDQSFVRDVLVDPNDAAIARTIVALGQILGLEVLAEGVETEDQRIFLAQHGCHAYQGFLFSQPLPAEQF